MAKVWKFGADVDTDQIVPGRYAPYMRPNVDVGEAAFIEARPDFNKNAQPGDLIVAGENFGCGSSREYAAEALRNRKVGAIIAASYARIFYRNALNLGIPLITVAGAIFAAFLVFLLYAWIFDPQKLYGIGLQNPNSIIYMGVMYLLALGTYLFFRSYRKKEGIDITKVHQEIPAE